MSCALICLTPFPSVRSAPSSVRERREGTEQVRGVPEGQVPRGVRHLERRQQRQRRGGQDQGLAGPEGRQGPDLPVSLSPAGW